MSGMGVPILTSKHDHRIEAVCPETSEASRFQPIQSRRTIFAPFLDEGNGVVVLCLQKLLFEMAVMEMVLKHGNSDPGRDFLSRNNLSFIGGRFCGEKASVPS